MVPGQNPDGHANTKSFIAVLNTFDLAPPLRFTHAPLSLTKYVRLLMID